MLVLVLGWRRLLGESVVDREVAIFRIGLTISEKSPFQVKTFVVALLNWWTSL